MSKRKSLNERRLTRRQVAEIIANEGAVLHEEWSHFIDEVLWNGNLKGHRVYELPGDRVLSVFSDKDISIPGKGDIYPREYWIRKVRSSGRHKEHVRLGINENVLHWRYYSRMRELLVDHIDLLIDELARILGMERSVLDGSYASLDVVSARVEAMGMDEACIAIYDNLVAYIGEVIRGRVPSEWIVDRAIPDQPFPRIVSKSRGHVLMPITVVWTALIGTEVDLRAETADEIRRGARIATRKRYLHDIIGFGEPPE